MINQGLTVSTPNTFPSVVQYQTLNVERLCGVYTTPSISFGGARTDTTPSTSLGYLSTVDASLPMVC
jgi:hypothetical protein